MGNINEKRNLTPNGSSKPQVWEYFIPGYNIFRIMQHALAQFAPAALAANDVVDYNVKRPIRTALGLSNKRTITEKSFTPEYLEELANITDSIARVRMPDLDKRLERGDTIPISINGKDYTTNYGGTKANRGIVYRTTNPIGQIETSLGSYNALYTKDDVLITDPYDWDTKVKLNNSSKYGVARNFMGKFGTPDSISNNNKTHINIRYTRKPTKK